MSDTVQRYRSDLEGLTHSSFCNETEDDVSDNERLEFLKTQSFQRSRRGGVQAFPDARRVNLRLKSVVVAQPSLAGHDRLRRQFTRLGRCHRRESNTTHRPFVRTFQAVIGAIFMTAASRRPGRSFWAFGRRVGEGKARRAAYRPKTELQMLTYGLAHKPPWSPRPCPRARIHGSGDASGRNRYGQAACRSRRAGGHRHGTKIFAISSRGGGRT